MAMFKPSHRERSGKCFVFLLAAFVILCALLLVLASVVRARNPHVKLRSVTLNQITYNASSQLPSFNATVKIFLSIRNPNYGDFSYANSRVSVLYEGAKMGDSLINGGTVGFRESKEINVAVKVRSAKVPVTPTFSNEINSGLLNLTNYVKISGTVHLFKIFNFIKSTEIACAMELNLATHAIKGPLEILSLSTSMQQSENNGGHNRISGLIVSLAGPNGGVLGSELVGVLTAATPLQVLLSNGGKFVLYCK